MYACLNSVIGLKINPKSSKKSFLTTNELDHDSLDPDLKEVSRSGTNKHPHTDPLHKSIVTIISLISPV